MPRVTKLQAAVNFDVAKKELAANFAKAACEKNLLTNSETVSKDPFKK